MIPLISDFLRRWWWAVVIVMLIAIVSTFGGAALMFAPIGPLLMLFDAQKGALRSVRVLPVSSRDQAVAWWIAAVLAFPVLSMVAMVPSAVVRTMIFHPKLSPWFDVGVQSYVGLGYSAFCFLVVLFLPTRPAERWYEHVVQGIAGASWGLSIPAVIFLLPKLPHSVAQIAPWHWYLFAAVPLLIAASAMSAGELLQKRSGPPATKGPVAFAAITRESGGFRGVPLFMMTIPLRIMAMLAVMIGLQWVFLQLIAGGVARNEPIVGVQTVMFGVLISAFTSELIGLRALRILPLSTGALVGLLLSGPAAAGVTVGILSAFGTSSNPMAFNPWTLFVFVSGLSTLVLAINLHLPGNGKIAVLFGGMIVLSLIFYFLPKMPGLLTALALGAGIAGTVMIYRGLRTSRAFYEPRRMMGYASGQAQ